MCLLIVDVQNDFLPGGSLPVHNGDQIIPLINRLQEQFSCVIASKDWHPKNHISFASRHGKKPGETVEIKGVKQTLWPDHCVQESQGAAFSPQLNTQKIQKVFLKGIDPEIDSYSAFYDNAHARSTGLGEYLQTLGIDEVVLVGLTTDYCVRYSAYDALQLGFKVTVVVDACRGIDLQPGDCTRAIQELKNSGVKII